MLKPLKIKWDHYKISPKRTQTQQDLYDLCFDKIKKIKGYRKHKSHPKGEGNPFKFKHKTKTKFIGEIL